MNTICGIGPAPVIRCRGFFIVLLVHGSLMYNCYLCLVMARGLSDLQKNILVIVNDQPGGGGYLTDINKQIKSTLFPDTWGRYIRTHGIYLREHYTWRQGEGYGRVVNGKWTADFEGFISYQKRLLKIRVTISNSISALVRRGLLTKTIPDGSGKEYKYSYLAISEAGRGIINTICIPP